MVHALLLPFLVSSYLGSFILSFNQQSPSRRGIYQRKDDLDKPSRRYVMPPLQSRSYPLPGSMKLSRRSQSWTSSTCLAWHMWQPIRQLFAVLLTKPLGAVVVDVVL